MKLSQEGHIYIALKIENFAVHSSMLGFILHRRIRVIVADSLMLAADHVGQGTSFVR